MTALDRRPQLLIVDDEVAHMQALCDTLQGHGYDTTGVSSGEAALASLRTQAFDLLLTDLMMPEVDGIAVIQAACAFDGDLACIIMTGKGSISSAVQAMKVGALDYIIKPFKVSSILPVLARALETRRLRMENAMLEKQLHAHAAELLELNRELEAAKRAAERANQEKSAFLSHMSHELRTPLNAILGFSEILASAEFKLSAAEARDFATDIRDAGTHLLSLINDILDLARVESGNMPLQWTCVAIQEVLDECATLTRPLRQARHIGIDFRPATDLYALADRTRLKQILINLLSNAIKYNVDNGQVTVISEVTAEGRLRILVQDTGPGLSQTQLDGLFRPFNRLGKEYSSLEGTGLGLVMSKKLAELMNARIGVSSQPGQGSTFWIDVATGQGAAWEQAESAGMPASRPRAGASTRRGRLLCIEDNPANLKLMTELIRVRGDLDFYASSQGGQGIETACRCRPDVILLDLSLPDMDGTDVCKVLKSNPLTSHIPVIATTARAMASEVSDWRGMGFFRYITKPIDMAELFQAIDDALAVQASPSSAGALSAHPLMAPHL
ncbi:MAG: response regulator [Curvibacter sp.]|nr:response regulator [Curvibacter sp.]